MKIMGVVLLLIIAFMNGARAHDGSAAFGNIRMHVTGGGWLGAFEQTSEGHRVKQTSLIDTAVGVGFGVWIQEFFIDYQASFFNSTKSNSTESRTASYSSWSGISGGYQFENLNLETYLGVEMGKYGFSTEEYDDFDGYSTRVGAQYFFSNYLGIRAEYRRFTGTEDAFGALPPPIRVHSDIYYVGLILAR